MQFVFIVILALIVLLAKSSIKIVPKQGICY
jgi:hypothetical protein